MQNEYLAAGASIGAPVAVMAAGLWAARRRDGEAAPGAAATARDLIPALALACIPVAWVIGFGMPGMPPKQAAEWLPLMAGLGVLVGIAACVRGVLARSAEWVLLAAGLAGAAMIARPLLEREETRKITAAWVAGAAAAMITSRWSLRSAGREGGALGPLLAIGAFSAASVVVVLTGHITPALMFGSLAAACGPALLLGFSKRSPRMGPALGGLSVPAAGLWVFTGVLGDTPPLCNALAALAVVMVGASGRLVPVAAKPVVRWVARLAMVGVPAAAAVGVALMNQPEGTW